MTTDDLGTCTYVAEKDDPSNWHGEGPDDWMLDEDSWSCPHDILDHEEVDREYCVFHLDPKYVPDDVDEAERFVRAVNEESDSDDEKVARRKKEFVGATFGEFELEEGTVLDAGDEFPVRVDYVTFPKGIIAKSIVVRHGISGNSINSATIVSFEGAELAGDISFTNADFSGDGGVSFFKTVFVSNGTVSFDYTEFEGNTQFDRAKFTGNSDVSFTGSEFASDTATTFRDTKFRNDGDISFIGTEFVGIGDVSFKGAKFAGDGNMSFLNANFANVVSVSFSDAEFADNRDVSFMGAKFDDSVSVSFEVAEFAGRVYLAENKFSDKVSFAGTKFGDCDLVVGSMQNMDLQRADFTNVNLNEVDFSKSNLEGAVFSRANLYGANFTEAQLDGAVFGNTRINQSTDFGDEIDYRVPYDPTSKYDSESRSNPVKCAVRRYLPKRPSWGDTGRFAVSEGANSDSDDRSGVNGIACEESSTDESSGKEGELLSAARAYHNLERIGRENSLPKLQRIGFVRRQEMHRLRYAEEASTAESGAWKLWLKWLRASVARLTLLYGESPWRVIAVSLGAIIFCGALYPFGGFRAGDPNNPELIRATSFDEWLSLLPDGIYFSTLTFTTLGFGDFQPAGWGRFLATGETALGATMIALLVFVLGRRAAR